MTDKRQTSKIFVGGLSWETTDQRLRTYFENYGAVSEAFVSFDRTTGRPRGFGFVVFEDPAVADKVVSLQHTIDRRDVEAKKAVPKEENPGAKQANGLSQRTKKIFVGGLAPSVDEHAFRKYFEQYGTVDDAVVMYDHDNKRPRGFGFITFSSEEAVDAVFTGGSLQTLHDKPIEIKRAVPRDQIASARGRTTFNQQPRMFSGALQGPNRMVGGQSGFAAAAMGPAFSGENGTLRGNLLTSHSLGAPNSQSNVQQLSGAFSLGAQGLPVFPHDIGAAISQGLAAGLLGAMSGQLSSQLPSHANGMQRVGSAQLPLGTNQLDEFIPQMNGMRLQGSNGLSGMGSGTLQSASSGMNQVAFSGGHSNGELLGGEFNHGNGYNAAAANGLKSAFAGLALDQPHGFASDLAPPNGFEERVSMLSAGSAGLGQLHSPSVTAAFAAHYTEPHHKAQEVSVSGQQW